MSEQPLTLAELHEELQQLINKGYEAKRRFNAEMDALHEQTRAVQMKVLNMLICEQSRQNHSPSQETVNL